MQHPRLLEHALVHEVIASEQLHQLFKLIFFLLALRFVAQFLMGLGFYELVGIVALEDTYCSIAACIEQTLRRRFRLWWASLI
jgi:hypothetical protein